MVTFFDISERIRVQRIARDSEAKFRTLYESSSDAVMLFDGSGSLGKTHKTMIADMPLMANLNRAYRIG